MAGKALSRPKREGKEGGNSSKSSFTPRERRKRGRKWQEKQFHAPREKKKRAEMARIAFLRPEKKWKYDGNDKMLFCNPRVNENRN